MHDDGADGIAGELAGPSVDLGVAEAVEREAGFPCLGGTAAQDVPVGGFRGAVGFGFQFAGGGEDFRVPIYNIDADPDAVPPPADRTLTGR